MQRPVFVYDDDCGFCTWCAEFVADHADLRLVGFSELDDDLLDRLPEDYEECSHLVTDEAVYSGGASIEEALVRSDLPTLPRPLVERLREFGGYERVREWGYRQGAHNRALLGKLVSKTPPARQGRDRDER